MPYLKDRKSHICYFWLKPVYVPIEKNPILKSLQFEVGLSYKLHPFGPFTVNVIAFDYKKKHDIQSMDFSDNNETKSIK